MGVQKGLGFRAYILGVFGGILGVIFALEGQEVGPREIRELLLRASATKGS